MEVVVYTSYYANLKHLPKDRCLAISQGVPAFARSLTILKELAPPWAWVKEAKQNPDYDPEAWKRRYLERLDFTLDPKDVAEQLNGKIILCWEPPGKRCHRHYVIEWLRAKGFEVRSEEWGKTQPSLF